MSTTAVALSIVRLTTPTIGTCWFVVVTWDGEDDDPDLFGPLASFDLADAKRRELAGKICERFAEEGRETTVVFQRGGVS